jgi:hypothetical protein
MYAYLAGKHWQIKPLGKPLQPASVLAIDMRTHVATSGGKPCIRLKCNSALPNQLSVLQRALVCRHAVKDISTIITEPQPLVDGQAHDDSTVIGCPVLRQVNGFSQPLEVFGRVVAVWHYGLHLGHTLQLGSLSACLNQGTSACWLPGSSSPYLHRHLEHWSRCG